LTEVPTNLAEAEAAISQLPDVVAVRSVFDGDGCEVHVLAAPGRSVEQVAADVRSIVAVQVRDLPLRDVHVVPLAADVTPGPDVRAPALAEAETGARVELVDVVVLFEDRGARIMATLERGKDRVTGSATSIATAAAVRRAVADATLTALLDLSSRARDVAIDTVLLVPLPAQQIAVVVLELLVPGGEVSLVGSALVRGSGVYEAVGRAVLDATNRPLSRPIEP
jgi:hypothetical protein